MAEALKARHCCGGIRRGRIKASDTLGVAIAIERQDMRIVKGLSRSLDRMSARGFTWFELHHRANVTDGNEPGV